MTYQNLDLFNIHNLVIMLGAVGVLVEWQSYRFKSGQAFRRWSAIGALFWAIQYLLLDALTASITMASTAIRSLYSDRLESGIYRHYSALGFVLWFGMLTIYTWQGLISLLPAFAVINTTLALFYLDNRKMRMTLLVSSLAWIGNDLYWQAWPALLAETVAMGINLRTIKNYNYLSA